MEKFDLRKELNKYTLNHAWFGKLNIGDRKYHLLYRVITNKN